MRSLLRRYPDFTDMRAALAGALWSIGKEGDAENNWWVNRVGPTIPVCRNRALIGRVLDTVYEHNLLSTAVLCCTCVVVGGEGGRAVEHRQGGRRRRTAGGLFFWGVGWGGGRR